MEPLQSQASLDDQLKVLGKLAIGAGLYDADDYLISIKRRVADLESKLSAARDECERLTGSRINTEAMLKAVIESKEIARRLAEEECAMLRKIIPVVDIDKAGEPTPELLTLVERQRMEADDRRVERVADELKRQFTVGVGATKWWHARARSVLKAADEK